MINRENIIAKRTLHACPTSEEFGIDFRSESDAQQADNQDLHIHQDLKPPRQDIPEEKAQKPESSVPYSASRSRRKRGPIRFAAGIGVCLIAFLIGRYLTARMISDSKPFPKSVSSVDTVSDSASGSGANAGSQSDGEAESSDADAAQAYFAALGLADLSHIGADTAENGSGFYITNIRFSKMVGEEQELKIIPWNSDWGPDESTDLTVDHDLGSLKVNYNKDDKRRASSYYYLPTDNIADFYQSEGNVSGWSKTQLEQRVIDGSTYSVFQVETGDGLLWSYAVEAIDQGAFVCRVEAKSVDAPDMDQLLEQALTGIQTKKESFESVLATSPLASRVIKDSKSGKQVVIKSDFTYEAEKMRYCQRTTTLDYGTHLFLYGTSGNFQIYHYYLEPDNRNDKNRDGTEEHIIYSFQDLDESGFQEESLRTGYSDSKVRSCSYGDVKKMDVNGRRVFVRFLKIHYGDADSEETEQREQIKIGLEVSEGRMLFIENEIKNPSGSFKDDLAATVQRLAGDNLELKDLEGE